MRALQQGPSKGCCCTPPDNSSHGSLDHADMWLDLVLLPQRQAQRAGRWPSPLLKGQGLRAGPWPRGLHSTWALWIVRLHPKRADALSALQVVELRLTSRAGSAEGGHQAARIHTLLVEAGAEGAAEGVAAGAAAGDGGTASALAQRRRSSLRTLARRSTLERPQRSHLSPATTVTRCGHST